jgi:hypothetical protein
MTEPMALSLMLADLESHRLEVQLAPLNPRMRNYNEGGMKRVVVDIPPVWYRAMCRKHTSSRGTRRGKQDTKIRRANVLSTLRVLAAGRKSWSKYAEELRGIARALK